MKGRVIAGFGRQVEVEAEGALFSCTRRGKKSDLAVGDFVEFSPTSPGQGVVEAIDRRFSQFFRSDLYREKTIAANVTLIVVVVAVYPSFSEELLNRCLIAAESQGIGALILLNKTDLAGSEKAAERLEFYRKLGYPFISLSAAKDVSPLLPRLHGHTSVLVGQSGMGKSTLINSLVPTAKRATGEVSDALDSGRHTTTHARLYHLGPESHIIDSPGLQEFGLNHLSREEIAHAFVEFRPYLGNCRFRNCRHLSEPGCALQEALLAGKIDERRMNIYRKLASVNTA